MTIYEKLEQMAVQYENAARSLRLSSTILRNGAIGQARAKLPAVLVAAAAAHTNGRATGHLQLPRAAKRPRASKAPSPKGTLKAAVIAALSPRHTLSAESLGNVVRAETGKGLTGIHNLVRFKILKVQKRNGKQYYSLGKNGKGSSPSSAEEAGG